MSNYLEYFIGTDTPFMLLFVILFFYTVKNNKDREIRNSFLNEKKLSRIEEEIQILNKVWKILLEKELEARK